MTDFLEEPARRLPVAGAYDVLVVGGGIAGVSAAVAAARRGAKVAILERQFALGGLATLANVCVFLPLCDGMGHQVVGGLAEELLKLSVKDVRRPDTLQYVKPPPECWRPGGDVTARANDRYDALFNPASLLLELEELARSSSVEIWYDTRFCGVLRWDDRITAVIVENKSGRSAFRARFVVDATGDADVCAAAGEETQSLDTNVLSGWFYLFRGGRLEMRPHSRLYSHVADRQGAQGPFFRGDDARQVTDHVLQTRRWLREVLAEERAAAAGADVWPFQLATLPAFRMTRRLVGSFTLNERHDRAWIDDCVGMTGDWRKCGPVFCLPMRSLCAVRNANLLAAGRCISVDGTVWDSTRSIPACAATGEAAGTIAAMACAGGDQDIRTMPPGPVQAQLRAQGVILDRSLMTRSG
ncbi:MAG: FAD-dependent oxidoreductase [Phycisphaerae bacterium]